jgi:hypothetical protein
MARDINRCIGTKNRPCSGLVCRRISPSSQTSPRWQTGTPVADGEFDCGPRAAVEIEPNLRRQSLKNGNIRGHGRRPSPICASILPIWESGDEIKRAKSADFRRNLAFPGELRQTPDCLADLGGFELAHSHLRNAL